MSTFTAGSNGANILTSILSGGAIANRYITSTAIDVTYTDNSEAILSGNFTLSNGAVTGGTLTGWASYGSNGALNWSVKGFSADVYTILLDDELGLDTSITNMVFKPGSTYYGSTNAKASDLLYGFGGGDTFIGGAATELFEPTSGTNTIKGGTGSNTVEFLGALNGYSIVNNGNDAITVTDSELYRNGIDHISGVQYLHFTDITATVETNGLLALPTATASQAVSWANVGDLEPIVIADYSANILSNLSGLEGLANQGALGNITLTDGGAPTFSITPTQLAADLAALKDIVSTNATVKVDASGPNLTLTGVGSLATVATFTGTAAEYSINTASDGSITVTDTGTGRTSVDHLSDFTALQFSDQTVFIAAPPGSANAVTTGNITELYSAVLARTPDVAGLAYYQDFLKANPATSLTSFAEYFLSSSEYTGNAAHNYAQSNAGETQFVTDIYTNLLHRSPDSGAVPFYLNVINGIVAHDTPGTAQYSSDDKYAHALVLTYISQSPEFLSDVQITAQSPASAQHWLVLS